MMEYKIWEQIITHLFVLCGVRRMTDSEHLLYMADMYSELKGQFSNEDITKAARAIAENENLYGNYPPLATWLKYCPQRRAQRILQQQQCSDFLGYIECLIDIEPISLECDSEMITEIDEKLQEIGPRAKSVVKQFGGLYRIRENGRVSKYSRDHILEELRNSWVASELDICTGALKIAENTVLKIENKN